MAHCHPIFIKLKYIIYTLLLVAIGAFIAYRISENNSKKNESKDKGGKKPIGQDHSLENYEDSEPTSGIGAIQDYSDRSSEIAHIEDDE